MLDEGRIMQTTANLLMQSVDEALDLVSHEPLCDWKGLKANVHFTSYYKLLQTSICPQKLVMYFIVERLESACYICAAFLRAHRVAQRQLHDFIGNTNFLGHCQHAFLVKALLLISHFSFLFKSFSFPFFFIFTSISQHTLPPFFFLCCYEQIRLS
jgi:hypothetical protein